VYLQSLSHSIICRKVVQGPASDSKMSTPLFPFSSRRFILKSKSRTHIAEHVPPLSYTVSKKFTFSYPKCASSFLDIYWNVCNLSLFFSVCLHPAFAVQWSFSTSFHCHCAAAGPHVRHDLQKLFCWLFSSFVLRMHCSHEGLYGFPSNFRRGVLAPTVPKFSVSKITDTD
jgi:hypothetical protein